MAISFSDFLNPFRPSVDQHRGEPDKPLIYARVSVVVLSVFSPLIQLLIKLPLTPLARGAAIVVCGISALTLLFFEFFRANKAADKLALESFVSWSNKYAANRIVNNLELLTQLIKDNPDVLNNRFITGANEEQSLIELAIGLPTLDAFKALVDAKVMINDKTFLQLLRGNNTLKFSYLISNSHIDDGRYSLNTLTRWTALKECPAFCIENLIRHLGLDPNEMLGDRYVLDLIIEAANRKREK